MKPITLDPMAAKMITGIAITFISVYTGLTVWALKKVFSSFINNFKLQNDNLIKSTKEQNDSLVNATKDLTSELKDIKKEVKMVQLTQAETKTKVNSHEGWIKNVEFKLDGHIKDHKKDN